MPKPSVSFSDTQIHRVGKLPYKPESFTLKQLKKAINRLTKSNRKKRNV